MDDSDPQERKRALAEAKRLEEEERKRRLDELADQEKREREQSKADFQKAKLLEEQARQQRLADTPKEVYEGGRKAVRDHQRLAPVAAHVQVAGEGLRQARVGVEASFRIVHADGQGRALDIADELQVEFFGPARIEGALDEPEPQTYLVRYTPPAPGGYELQILLKNVHVPGSPFKLEVAPQCPSPEGGRASAPKAHV